MKHSANDVPAQMGHLKTLMQEADVEWDTLTRSIQTDEELLAVLERSLKHSLLALSLQGERPSSVASSLQAQVKALQRHMFLLEQGLILEYTRRDAVIQRFEQTRLALAALRRVQTASTIRFRGRHYSVYQVYHGLKHLLHWLWLALQESGSWYNDRSSGTVLIGLVIGLVNRRRIHMERHLRLFWYSKCIDKKLR